MARGGRKTGFHQSATTRSGVVEKETLNINVAAGARNSTRRVAAAVRTTNMPPNGPMPSRVRAADKII